MDDLTDEEKAAEVLAHCRGGIAYRFPSKRDVALADIMIGDRCDGSNKYDILKCRYLLSPWLKRRVLPSNVQLLDFLRRQTEHARNQKILWVKAVGRGIDSVRGLPHER